MIGKVLEVFIPDDNIIESNKRIELLADNPQFFLHFARNNTKFYTFL